MKKIAVALTLFFIIVAGRYSDAMAADRAAPEGDTTMRIAVSDDDNTVIFNLNDSSASRGLYAQLPLSIEIGNFGGIEKIFYPPEKLNTGDTPLVIGAQTGTLAYYAPWGDVVLFHASFGAADGLYELGHAVSGSDRIEHLSGTVRITKSSTD